MSHAIGNNVQESVTDVDKEKSGTTTTMQKMYYYVMFVNIDRETKKEEKIAELR